jgi:transposase-like protein
MNEPSSEAVQNPGAPARKCRTYSTAEKAEWVKKYQQSGLSQREFSKQAGIEYMSLYRWARKERERSKPAQQCVQSAVGFAELQLPPSTQRSAWAAELALANGTVLRLTKDTPPTLVDQLLRIC